jgi:uncharacterized protein (DUF983 family)
MGNWFDGAEAAAFKPVANGYVMRAPFIGPSRYYLVNEAERAAILERMREARRVSFPASLIAILLGAGLVVFMAMALKPDGSMPVVWILAMLLAVIAPIVATMQIYLMHRLRPLLAGLQPATQDKVRWLDHYKALAMGTSLPRLIGLGFGSIAMGFMQAFQLAKAVQHGGPLDGTILNAVALACSVFLTIYFFALAFYKASRS